MGSSRVSQDTGTRFSATQGSVENANQHVQTIAGLVCYCLGVAAVQMPNGEVIGKRCNAIVYTGRLVQMQHFNAT